MALADFGYQAARLIETVGAKAPGRRKLAVKVVDVFGSDTMTIVEVTV